MARVSKFLHFTFGGFHKEMEIGVFINDQQILGTVELCADTLAHAVLKRCFHRIICHIVCVDGDHRVVLPGHGRYQRNAARSGRTGESCTQLGRVADAHARDTPHDLINIHGLQLQADALILISIRRIAIGRRRPAL